MKPTFLLLLLIIASFSFGQSDTLVYVEEGFASRKEYRHFHLDSYLKVKKEKDSTVYLSICSPSEEVKMFKGKLIQAKDSVISIDMNGLTLKMIHKKFIPKSELRLIFYNRNEKLKEDWAFGRIEVVGF